MRFDAHADVAELVGVFAEIHRQLDQADVRMAGLAQDRLTGGREGNAHAFADDRGAFQIGVMVAGRDISLASAKRSK